MASSGEAQPVQCLHIVLLWQHSPDLQQKKLQGTALDTAHKESVPVLACFLDSTVQSTVVDCVCKPAQPGCIVLKPGQEYAQSD